MHFHASTNVHLWLSIRRRILIILQTRLNGAKNFLLARETFFSFSFVIFAVSLRENKKKNFLCHSQIHDMTEAAVKPGK